MKMIIAILGLLIAMAGYTQVASGTTKKQKTSSLYQLPLPTDWDKELFYIPIDFAPAINYKGQEELRFAPGWGTSQSEQYWTYAYLWYIDGKPVINGDTIRKNLTEYYTGLVGRNVTRRNIPKERVVPVDVSVNEIRYEGNDENTYQAVVRMLDYMEQKPITLQVKVHVILCTNNHTAILFQVSPKLMSHPLWKTLNSIRTGFNCR